MSFSAGKLKHEAGGRRLAVAFLAIVITAAACSPSTGPKLQFAADPTVSWWVATSDMAPNQPLSIGAIVLCVSSASTALLKSVAIHDAQGDIDVKAFAVRPNPIPSGGVQLGGERIALADLAMGFVTTGRQEVSGVCPKDIAAPTDPEVAGEAELAVEVRLRSGDIGGGRALEITYAIDGGSEQRAMIPFGIWLCAATCPSNLGAPTPAPS